MKRFFQIVGGAVVCFIALSMLQERETFSRNWFAPTEPSRGSKEDRTAAAEAVHRFRTLTAHWYATDGDRRFGERLPATEPVVEELRSDIAYVRKNGRLEIPRLMQLEVLSSEVTSEGSAEVRTREFWVTEFHWLGGGTSDETRSDIVYARYRLTRDGERWIVAAWDPVDAPEQERG